MGCENPTPARGMNCEYMRKAKRSANRWYRISMTMVKIISKLPGVTVRDVPFESSESIENFLNKQKAACRGYNTATAEQAFVGGASIAAARRAACGTCPWYKPDNGKEGESDA